MDFTPFIDQALTYLQMGYQFFTLIIVVTVIVIGVRGFADGTFSMDR